MINRLYRYQHIDKLIQLAMVLFIAYFSSKLIAKGQAVLPFFSYFAVVFSFSILINANIAILVYFVGIALSQMSMISDRLFGMPGLSIINILCVNLVMIFALHVNYSVRFSTTFKRLSILFWIVISGSVIYSAIRMDDFRVLFPEATIYQHLRGDLIRPFIVWLGFIMIIYIVKTNEDFKRIFRYLLISIIVISMIILIANAYYFSQGHDYMAVRVLVGDFIGIHANDYGVMFTLTIPVILGAVLSGKDKFLKTIAMIGACLAVLFSYSRACYVATLLSLVLFSTLKVKRYIIILIPLIILAPWITPDSVKERTQYGFTKNLGGHYHGTTGDYISAGRFSMWARLFSEFIDNEKQVLMGNGRYSIYRTKARKLGIIRPGHPHNAYLEVLFDTGILGMIVFALFYGYLFRSLLREYRRLKNSEYEKLYFGGLVMFASYLILCIAGRSLFPEIRFFYFWLILGLLFAISKITSSAERGIFRN